MRREDIISHESVVKDLLTNNPTYRDSDALLYLAVLEKFGYDTNKPISYYFSNNSNYPRYGTITRTRRKVQECYPELAPSEKVGSARAVNRLKYVSYSRRRIPFGMKFFKKSKG